MGKKLILLTICFLINCCSENGHNQHRIGFYIDVEDFLSVDHQFIIKEINIVSDANINSTIYDKPIIISDLKDPIFISYLDLKKIQSINITVDLSSVNINEDFNVSDDIASYTIKLEDKTTLNEIENLILNFNLDDNFKESRGSVFLRYHASKSLLIDPEEAHIIFKPFFFLYHDSQFSSRIEVNNEALVKSLTKGTLKKHANKGFILSSGDKDNIINLNKILLKQNYLSVDIDSNFVHPNQDVIFDEINYSLLLEPSRIVVKTYQYLTNNNKYLFWPLTINQDLFSKYFSQQDIFINGDDFQSLFKHYPKENSLIEISGFFNSENRFLYPVSYRYIDDESIFINLVNEMNSLSVEVDVNNQVLDFPEIKPHQISLIFNEVPVPLKWPISRLSFSEEPHTITLPTTINKSIENEITLYSNETVIQKLSEYLNNDFSLSLISGKGYYNSKFKEFVCDACNIQLASINNTIQESQLILGTNLQDTQKVAITSLAVVGLAATIWLSYQANKQIPALSQAVDSVSIFAENFDKRYHELLVYLDAYFKNENDDFDKNEFIILQKNVKDFTERNADWLQQNQTSRKDFITMKEVINLIQQFKQLNFDKLEKQKEGLNKILEDIFDKAKQFEKENISDVPRFLSHYQKINEYQVDLSRSGLSWGSNIKGPSTIIDSTKWKSRKLR